MKPPGKFKPSLATAKTTWLSARFAQVMKLARQPTLLSMAMFAVSGTLFALGNLLLARTMPIAQFGHFALGIALFNLFALVAPLGIDQLVFRMRIAVGWRLALLVAAIGGAMGGVVAGCVVLAGGLRPIEAAMVALAIMAGGLNTVVSGVLRSRGQTREAIPFATGGPWILFAIGVLGQFTPFATPFWPLALFMVGNMLRAAFGWRLLLGKRRWEQTETMPVDWVQSFSLVGLAAIGTTSIQLERLVIPVALKMSDLALFAVLSSVAIFPFRLLIQAAGFAFTSRLAVTPDPAARRALIRTELFIMALLAGAATVAILLLVTPLTPLLLGGSYAIHESLILAACVNGSIKLLYALARAVVTVCGSKAQVAKLNGLGLLWLVLAAIGGVLGSGWGLIGLMMGVNVGGLLTMAPLWLLARQTVEQDMAMAQPARSTG